MFSIEVEVVDRDRECNFHACTGLRKSLLSAG